MVATDTHVARVARFSAVAALSMRDVIQGWLDEEPGMPGHEIIARLDQYAGERIQISRDPDGDRLRSSICRHCGQLIISTGQTRWEHEHGFTGCRAASFTIEQGWNDDLDPTWEASPT